YIDANGSGPQGAFWLHPQFDPTQTRHAWSQYIGLLPFMEQAPLYNAFNNLVNIFDWPNALTINSAAISTFWCPSDPKIVATTLMGSGYFGLTPFTFNSYGGNLGYFPSYPNARVPNGTVTLGDSNYQAIVAQTNGVIYYDSHTTIGDITDGTSNTMLIG